MSIYNKLSEARKNIKSNYKDDQAIRDTLLYLLTELIIFAFQNEDELPKTFEVDAKGWTPKSLKEFLEEVGIEVESVTLEKKQFIYESKYKVKLI